MNVIEGLRILYKLNGGDEADLKSLVGNTYPHMRSVLYGDGLYTPLGNKVSDAIEKMAEGGGGGGGDKLPPVDDLNNMSWDDIKIVSDHGEAENYFSVGDAKAIELNGTVGTLALNNVTLYAYILGFDHNPDYEEPGITFGTFKTAATDGIDVCLDDSNYGSSKSDGTKTFNINHWGSDSSPYNTNYGGWKGCDLRYDILGSTNVEPSGYGATATTSRVGYDPSDYNITTSPVSETLLSTFPQSLRAVMKPNTKYTDNIGNSSNELENVTASIDYLWLLSEYEIFDNHTNANLYEQNYQAQYQYYIDGASKIKYKHSNSTSAAAWCGRSPFYNTDEFFCCVNPNESASNCSSRFSLGLAPAFLV